MLVRGLTKWSRKELDHLFKHAQKTSARAATLRVRRSPRLNADYARLLIITPVKLGSAPERNQVRRRLKAIFFQEKLYEQPYDLIVSVYPRAISADYTLLKQELLRLAHDVQG
jgi:ribonuclease P protein component